MKVTEVRKMLMSAVLGLATAFLATGLLLGNEALLVVGWIHGIMYMLWHYGQTLHKP